MKDFTGVKIALLLDKKLILIQRDEKPGLRFAGMWDFPGGGREHNESPFECARREVAEELSLNLQESSVIWQKEVPSMHDPNSTAYFLVAKIDKQDITTIQLGNEGQRWSLMPVKEFYERTDVVPKLKDRLRAYFKSLTIVR